MISLRKAHLYFYRAVKRIYLAIIFFTFKQINSFLHLSFYSKDTLLQGEIFCFLNLICVTFRYRITSKKNKSHINNTYYKYCQFPLNYTTVVKLKVKELSNKNLYFWERNIFVIQEWVPPTIICKYIVFTNHIVCVTYSLPGDAKHSIHKF